ncbi:hypothetical protein JHK87_042286 [Glycine soja]|nr:hypothetical protein JHK87_042286 [Glycine soja]
MESLKLGPLMKDEPCRVVHYVEIMVGIEGFEELDLDPRTNTDNRYSKNIKGVEQLLSPSTGRPINSPNWPHHHSRSTCDAMIQNKARIDKTVRSKLLDKESLIHQGRKGRQQETPAIVASSSSTLYARDLCVGRFLRATFMITDLILILMFVLSLGILSSRVTRTTLLAERETRFV